MKPSFYIPIVTLVLLTIPGCLIVRTTEHRIKFTGDGSGEAMIRLIDIRSDGKNEDEIANDFNSLMEVYNAKGLSEFENEARTVTSKQLIVRGDSLIAEIRYTFSSLEGLEGFRSHKDEIFVAVAPRNEVVKSNGSVESYEKNRVRIRWDRSDKKLMYQITEKDFPSSVSLARRFLRTTQ